MCYTHASVTVNANVETIFCLLHSILMTWRSAVVHVRRWVQFVTHAFGQPKCGSYLTWIGRRCCCNRMMSANPSRYVLCCSVRTIDLVHFLLLHSWMKFENSIESTDTLFKPIRIEHRCFVFSDKFQSDVKTKATEFCHFELFSHSNKGNAYELICRCI